MGPYLQYELTELTRDREVPGGSLMQWSWYFGRLFIYLGEGPEPPRPGEKGCSMLWDGHSLFTGCNICEVQPDDNDAVKLRSGDFRWKLVSTPL